MADPVSVTQNGVTVTSNTVSEADLRAELEAPPEADQSTPPADQSAPPADVAAPVRDDKGRFVKRDGTDQSPAPADQSPAPTDQSAPPARRRDDALPRHNPIARMNQALAQKAEAERKAAALEAELQRLRGGVNDPPPQGQPGGLTRGPSMFAGSERATTHAGPEPQFEQFTQEADPYTAYVQAWARWDNQRQVDARFAQFEAGLAARAEQQTFDQRIQEGAQKYADWDDALTQAATLGLQVSEVMRAAITQSPKAADLVHFLATHPEECLQLAEESLATPVAAAPVMRRLLESQVSPPAATGNGHGSAARPKVSTAKPPVQPVGSSPVGSDAPPGEDASAAEHARYWNRKLRVPGTK